MSDRVEEHFRLFNDAVRSQDEQPPSDTMSCVSDARDAAGGGTLSLTWRDGSVADLTIAFDPS